MSLDAWSASCQQRIRSSSLPVGLGDGCCYSLQLPLNNLHCDALVPFLEGLANTSDDLPNISTH